MPITITMPRLSDTMESGTVLKWNVAEGQAVASGDVVADVETDKATMELTVYDDGTIAKILVGEGQTVDVGTTIAVLAEDGEDQAQVAATAAANGGGASVAAPAEPAATPKPSPSTPTAVATVPDDDDGRRLRVSPVARRLADEHRIDVRSLSGSGPGGRIIKRDVLGAIGTAEETAASIPPSAMVPVTPVPVQETAASAERGLELVGQGGLEAARLPLSNMRQTIARRLVESTTTIPHYQVSMVFDMDPLLALRKTLNTQLEVIGVKLSVNDFLVRCCALAMHQHAEFNASWDDDAIIVHGAVNIGIAISMPAERGGGLVVAVIRHADQKSLRAISVETRELATRARTRGLSIEEMSDSTFTLSNLGMFGVEHFTAIINPPNSAIMAVGAAVLRPVVRDGELTVGHEMTATLSSDHRVIDGAMAAMYLKTLKAYIENPATIMV